MHFWRNSPTKVENGLNGEQKKAVVNSSPILTHNTRVYVHHVLLYNLPPKVENGMDRKQEKAVIISSHTFTQTHAFLYSSPAKLRMGWTSNKKRQ